MDIFDINSDLSSISRGLGARCQILDSIKIKAVVDLGGKSIDKLTLGSQENMLRTMLNCWPNLANSSLRLVTSSQTPVISVQTLLSNGNIASPVAKFSALPQLNSLSLAKA